MPIHSQVKLKVDHAISWSTTRELFPKEGVCKNVYYIIGFLRNQASKEAKRRSEKSGVRLCLEFVAGRRFYVWNRGESDCILSLIENPEVPTDLVHERELFGGLQYPSVECWSFFGVIEYIYAQLAIPDNLLCHSWKYFVKFAMVY